MHEDENSMIDILAEDFSLDDLIRQNEVEAKKVIKWLVEEGLLDLDEYFSDNDTLIERMTGDY